MKRPVVALLLFVFQITLMAGCASNDATNVTAVEKTGSYHRAHCPIVTMAKTTTMTVAEARAKHLKPCLRCRPDTI